MVRRLLTLLKRSVGHSSPESQQDDDSEPVAQLYECSYCDTVYIDEEMQSCPECGRGVTQVPNERTLNRDDAAKQ